MFWLALADVSIILPPDEIPSLFPLLIFTVEPWNITSFKDAPSILAALIAIPEFKFVPEF